MASKTTAQTIQDALKTGNAITHPTNIGTVEYLPLESGEIILVLSPDWTNDKVSSSGKSKARVQGPALQVRDMAFQLNGYAKV